jgi:hypothetical protein
MDNGCGNILVVVVVPEDMGGNIMDVSFDTDDCDATDDDDDNDDVVVV